MEVSNTKSRLGETSGNVDWSAIHKKLEELQKRITSDAIPTDSAREIVLKERANLLAKSETPENSSFDHVELLFFQLSGEEYAIESTYVEEVHPLIDLTELPGVPPFVLGVIYVRGRVVTVIDLGTLFELPRQGLTDQDRVIVVSDGMIELGLLANLVFGIAEVSEESIQEPLSTLWGLRAEILIGLTPERAVVLDMARLLSHERIQVEKRRE